MKKNVELIISWGNRLKIHWKNINPEKVIPITWLMAMTILLMWTFYLILTIYQQA